MGSRHCAVDNIVDSSIRGSSINVHTTVVVTGVGAAKGDPRRRPIVTRTVLLSMCNLNDEAGRAFSHAPDSFTEVARSGAQRLGLASAGCRPWQKHWEQSRPSDSRKQDQTGGRSRPVNHTLVDSST